jgi:hypothetical protein
VPVQRRGLGENVTLKTLQCCAGVDAQLVSQPRPGGPQHRQRLGLAPGSVQPEDQQLTSVFPERMGRHVGLQLGHRDFISPQSQQRSTPPLEHRQRQLLQPRHLRYHPCCITHLGVGLPTP